MKKGLQILIGIFLSTFLGAMASYAAISDVNKVREANPDVTVSCTVCHEAGNFKALNEYGQAYKDAGRNADAVQAIADEDSDADGVTNAEELKAGTNPGDAEDN
ncbi:MAG: thrombospondin type 3 repeat-containing protein [Candidatus Omnitrophota bacterium]